MLIFLLTLFVKTPFHPSSSPAKYKSKWSQEPKTFSTNSVRSARWRSFFVTEKDLFICYFYLFIFVTTTTSDTRPIVHTDDA